MKNPSPIASDLKAIVSIARTRRTKVFAYGFLFAFVACTAFLAFNPSSNSSSPWFSNLFTSSSTNSLKASIAPYRSQVSSFFSHLFPNSSSPSNIGTAVSVPKLVDGGGGSSKDPILGSGSGRIGALKENQTRSSDSPKNGVPDKSQVKNVDGVKKDGATEVKSESGSGVTEEKQVGNGSKGSGVTEEKQVKNGSGSGKNGVEVKKGGASEFKNKTESGSGVTEEKQVKNGSGSGKNGAEIKKDGNLKAQKQNESGVSNKNQTSTTQIPQKGTGVSANSQKDSKASSTQKGQKGIVGEGAKVSNLTDALSKGNESAKVSSNGNGKKKEKWIEDMIGCDIFHGHWVKDESYPLYPEGSCPHIDEPFDCYHNGRPDRSYQKLRWQPSGCNIPRLNAKDMLERLRGKRLVFVGDSLNRNMWESLVCVLRNSLKDKKKVFEASGRHEFRTEGSYSFLFKDYKATVEFFRSPFLVQEWEMPNGNGTKETLRLDIIERSSSKYKDAHFIIFNTGHWWTHEKTSKGKDYYQEGNRVYSELNVVDAFHKALNTWAKWVDANVNPKKSFVFFRGYSASHFSGGQWNSGGACDKETEPIKNENYLSSYPTKMSVLESVIKGMKTPVSYLNITRMTDYRKDAHPSVYRKQSLTEEERKDPLRFQDCSHWCLPGVPDSWNELLYAQLIIKQYQMGQ